MNDEDRAEAEDPSESLEKQSPQDRKSEDEDFVGKEEDNYYLGEQTFDDDDYLWLLGEMSEPTH